MKTHGPGKATRRVYPEELKKAFPRAGIVSRLMLY